MFHSSHRYEVIIIDMAANYEIKLDKVLGKGGFATVYQGIIKNSGAPCAIKVIHQAALDNKILEMAEKEIKVLNFSDQNFI